MSQNIFDNANKKLDEINNYAVSNLEELEAFRIAFLGSKNTIKPLFGEIRNVENERKKEYGQLMNAIKQAAEAKFGVLKANLVEKQAANIEVPDLSRPVNADLIGSRHPNSIIMNEILEIFTRLGFNISEGPEIEDDWHNFTALNFPPHHPARDMQDTFFITNDISLRTHTSSVQVRVMENQKPPIRTISPGRVYRNETISARSHCQFHQVEGLYVDEGVSFADLKQTLFYFAQEMYGKDVKVRFRPSYFPFTEISAEMDVSCLVCAGDGCGVCKKTGWVEILGCGMVDPNVLENCGIDSKKYTGFAFGMGIERQVMLRYRINDIRHFFENDIRFLKQFGGAV